MADAYICRRGGSSGGAGGSELVIVGGTTSPAKATHNTIWVNTPTEITSYVLAGTEPAIPIAGMVWLTIGAGGSVKMASPVGDDWVVVYPLSAKQYVDGVWVDRTAKSYQNGEWVGWTVHLYNGGDECTDITGGWTVSKASNGTSVKNADHVYFSYTGSSNIQSYLRTTNKISFPFRGYKTLKARLDVTSHFSSSGSLMGLTTNTQADRGEFDLETGFTDVGNGVVISLDISSAKGDFYVSFYSGMKTSKLYEVWFE